MLSIRIRSQDTEGKWKRIFERLCTEIWTRNGLFPRLKNPNKGPIYRIAGFSNWLENLKYNIFTIHLKQQHIKSTFYTSTWMQWRLM